MAYPDSLALPRFIIRQFMPFVLPQADGQGASNAKPALTTETCKEDSMAKCHLPDADLLRKLLRYEPETGTLYWQARPTSMFKSAAYCSSWNTRYADKPALNCIVGGYRKGTLKFGSTRLRIAAHRIIWAMVHGEWAPMIDHINQDGTDNRLANLRSVSREENSRNASLCGRNKSGRIGVNWAKTKAKWRAKIRAEGRYIELGYFATFEAACKAREAAEKLHGYHPNHGRAA